MLEDFCEVENLLLWKVVLSESMMDATEALGSRWLQNNA